MIRLAIFLIAASWLALGAGPAAAAEPETGNDVRILKVLKKCPESEPTCIVFHVSLLWPKGQGDSSWIIDHPNVVLYDESEPASYGYGTAHLIVRGRLEGGPEKTYRLLLVYPTDMLECGDFWATAVGVSGETGGTVLTDAGRLEIVDAPLQFGCHDCVLIIDKKSLTISNRISPFWERYSWGGEPAITREGDFFLKYGDRCISAGQPGPFKLIPEDQCIPLSLDRPSPADVERVRSSGILSEHKNSRLKYDLYQPKGAPFLVNIYGVACT